MVGRVIVTGGAGFVGSSVVEQLAGAGFDVAVLDVQKPLADVDWVKGSILDYAWLKEQLKDYDATCHLAAVGDVYEALRDPQKTVRLNVEGTLNLLLAAAETGMKRVVYASTWEVYGRIRYQPVDEDHPCTPHHPYSISKLAGEQLCTSVGELKNLSVLCLRLGTAYGPNMRESAVMTKFIEAGLRRKPIRIYGSGEQFRQFTHVRDIGDAFALALKYSGQVRVLNIASEEPVSILRLAGLVKERFGIPLEFRPQREGEPVSALISSLLARKEIGWTPRVPFQEGFEEMLRLAHKA